MNPLLIYRCDITNLVIMTGLLIYALISEKRNRIKQGPYMDLVVAALCHCLFALITEISVNNQQLPKFCNDILHMFYFATCLIFCRAYYQYVTSFVIPKKIMNRQMKIVNLVTVAGIVLSCVFPYEYIKGKGTYYAFGTGALICYGMAYFTFFITTAIFLNRMKNVSKIAKVVILPTGTLILVLLTVQLFFPEFLFTGSAMTIISTSFLFSTSNPVNQIRERSFIDYSTGLHNRNSYENDLAKYTNFNKEVNLVYVMCDLNYLKHINDTYGHIAGDNHIMKAADILQCSLKSATKLYRVGGDEFVAIYHDVALEVVEKEIEAARKACLVFDSRLKVPVELAIGYAILEKGEATDAWIKRADDLMYEDKARLKKASNIPSR